MGGVVPEVLAKEGLLGTHFLKGGSSPIEATYLTAVWAMKYSEQQPHMRIQEINLSRRMLQTLHVEA